MHRSILNELKIWKTSPTRKPLLLRGARQVGKSWLVKEFAHQFEHFVEINFEQQPQACALFSGDLQITNLLQKLELFYNNKIIVEKTLLFFDEVQECPRAITALRYFKEQCPKLHIIAAGSLIDFTLETIGMPVGRVQFLYLYPLSFHEFLMAQQRNDLIDYIEQREIEPVIHQQLLEQIKTYFYLGGMPSIVQTWLDHHDMRRCKQLQQEIIQAYRQDFMKYASAKELKYLDLLLNAIPQQLGKKFKYVNVDKSIRSNELKPALNALCKAGIAYKINHSSAQGFPLTSSQKQNHFKMFLFDIGLTHCLLRLELNEWILTELEVQFIGAIAEQFVAQEYIAYSDCHTPADLFYWHRQEKTSNAEVDFVFTRNNDIVPVEVKAGRIGTLKSLLLFLKEHEKSQYGLRICELNFDNDENRSIETIPFYGLKTWLHKKSL